MKLKQISVLLSPTVSSRTNDNINQIADSLLFHDLLFHLFAYVAFVFLRNSILELDFAIICILLETRFLSYTIEALC